MKHFILWILMLLATSVVLAQNTPTLPWDGTPSPKHEVRAVWLTVVMGLDWPRTTNQQQQHQQVL